MPDVDVVPSEHFNTVLYTGNGSTQSITGVGFQPDFLWVKNRSSGSDDHQLYDAVRTAPKMLKSNDTTAEINAINGITSFNSDGFTTGSSGGTNNNNSAIVAWNWKANGSGSSNTDGTITSTVSANVDAGFSISTYTGTGSAATIGHGLSKAPEMFIVKNREAGGTGSGNWNVFVTVIDGSMDELALNKTDAKADRTLTAPTTSVISIGTSDERNQSGIDYLAYAFHSVDGYSKVGSYTGNGNADGTFIYTGFRPAFVICKMVTDAGEGWIMRDNARDPFNVVENHLNANQSYADSTASQVYADFLSNG